MYSKLFLSSFHAEYIFDYRVQQEKDEEGQGSLNCDKCPLFRTECKKCIESLRLQFEKEGGEPGINGDIQDAEEDATVPEEDEEKFIVLEKEKLTIPTEAEDEEELQEDIAKSELDRLDELRLELCCDRRSYAMRVSAIWFFQVTFSILIILEADFKI